MNGRTGARAFFSLSSFLHVLSCSSSLFFPLFLLFTCSKNLAEKTDGRLDRQTEDGVDLMMFMT